MVKDSIERIKLLRKTLGLTQEEFAQRLGFTGTNPSATVSNWESGKTQPTRVYPQISQAFNVSLDWLLSGEGEMFANQYGDANSNLKNSIEIQGILNDQLPLRFDLNLLRSNKRNFELLKYFRVDSDSMAPTIMPSDIVLIDTSATQMKIDSIYLLKINENFVIRRVAVLRQAIAVLSCDNKLYDQLQFDLSNTEYFDIIGKVVWLGRTL